MVVGGGTEKVVAEHRREEADCVISKWVIGSDVCGPRLKPIKASTAHTNNTHTTPHKPYLCRWPARARRWSEARQQRGRWQSCPAGAPSGGPPQGCRSQSAAAGNCSVCVWKEAGGRGCWCGVVWHSIAQHTQTAWNRTKQQKMSEQAASNNSCAESPRIPE